MQTLARRGVGDAAAGHGLHFLYMSEGPFSHDAGQMVSVRIWNQMLTSIGSLFTDSQVTRVVPDRQIFHNYFKLSGLFTIFLSGDMFNLSHVGLATQNERFDTFEKYKCDKTVVAWFEHVYLW